jgi:hypothetical protein
MLSEISNTGSEVKPVLRAVDVGGQAFRKFDQQAVGDPSCVVQQLKLFQQVAAKKNRHFLFLSVPRRLFIPALQ